ncbi:MAG: adenylate kinase [Candidatus Buchananbacteria bacterium RBG_13_36_9]|uniref:Adenylate kinase n=1 Tax=Candidatus Buchananbacteria bacterium RBG_13_36_9 TaxID=1797530 RepID=A0A1G1XN00_9BACT|nr:MAG: adenylate kinase [Candidatus Buchananbacteria bacterium RBG_13_36_9]
MKIIMFGPQGSGKGTQAELLAAKFKIPTISAGALYRDNIKRKTKLGKLAEKFTKQGILGSDSLTNNMMKAELKKPKYKRGVILDGYPRNINQAKFLNKFLQIERAVLIDISERETIKRLSSRRVCSVCGQTFNIINKKPKKSGICDKCKGILIQRADDNPRAIKKRLSVYRQETIPVLDYYKKQGKLIRINGKQSIQQVYRDILKYFPLKK